MQVFFIVLRLSNVWSISLVNIVTFSVLDYVSLKIINGDGSVHGSSGKGSGVSQVNRCFCCQLIAIVTKAKKNVDWSIIQVKGKASPTVKHLFTLTIDSLSQFNPWPRLFFPCSFRALITCFFRALIRNIELERKDCRTANLLFVVLYSCISVLFIFLRTELDRWCY